MKGHNMDETPEQAEARKLKEKTGKEVTITVKKGLGIDSFDTKELLTVQLDNEVFTLSKWSAHDDGVRGNYPVGEETYHAFIRWETIRTVTQTLLKV
jgi:hypothetical protein